MLSLIYYDHHAGKINQQRFGSIIFLLRIRIRHTNQKRIRIRILVNQLQIAWNGWLTQKEKNVRILPLGHNQISAVTCRQEVFSWLFPSRSNQCFGVLRSAIFLLLNLFKLHYIRMFFFQFRRLKGTLHFRNNIGLKDSLDPPE